MPSSPACRFYWLRYGASVALAAGGCFCATRALEHRPAAAVAVVTLPVEEKPFPLPEPEKPEIVIDPGHGGSDPGTMANGQLEKTWTLSVGNALAKELRDRGWPVVLTRDGDTAVPLPERSTFANQKPRLAFVSLHFNSGRPEATGVESYYAWPRQPEVQTRLTSGVEIPEGHTFIDDRSRLLAECLQAAVCEATGAKNRGIRNDPTLSVTGRTLCPAVLVELGFLTNAAECRTIQTEVYREKVVRSLAVALDSWLRGAAAPGYGIRCEPAEKVVPVVIRNADNGNHP